MEPNDLLRLDAIVTVLNRAMYLHDTWEVGHGQRSKVLIEKLGMKMELPQMDIVLLKYLAQIHDCGKLGIAEHILSRKRLSVSEKDMIKGHPYNGYEIIKDMGFDERLPLGLLQHHEHWDGSGYPSGLKGKEIILFARLALVVDTYDAISSERASHNARTVTQTLKIMEKEAGVKSDPEIFKIFKKMMSENAYK